MLYMLLASTFVLNNVPRHYCVWPFNCTLQSRRATPLGILNLDFRIIVQNAGKTL
jgi:hypothetical protein